MLMKRILTSLCGLAIGATGFSLLLPALNKAEQLGAMPNTALGTYSLGLILFLMGSLAAILALCCRRAA